MPVTLHYHSGQTEPSATEGSRRLTGVAEGSANHLSTPPNPEVEAKPVRRLFSKAFKLRILQQWDRCHKPGDKAAILRREGLYSQTVALWIKQRSQGKLKAAPGVKITGAPKDPADSKRLMELEIENERLHRQLAQAQKIIEVQKKLSELLQIPLEPIDFEI